MFLNVNSNELDAGPRTSDGPGKPKSCLSRCESTTYLFKCCYSRFEVSRFTVEVGLKEYTFFRHAIPMRQELVSGPIMTYWKRETVRV